MFWAYFSLSQWLIIYSGNLPEETTYYLNRGMNPKTGQTVYWWLATIILLGQFFIPFLCLLSGKTKRSPSLLGNLALGMLFVRLLDIFWTILPFFHPEGSGQLLDLVWMSLGPLSLI